MPKIANPRNHQGADTDARTRGFICKLKLGSKYTQHSGAGTWTPKWVTARFSIGWSRGFSEGMEEFLKFCLHFDMGLSRALSSVLILIGASCPWLGLCSHSKMGLSATGVGSVVFLIWDYLPRTLRTFCSFSHKVQLLFTGT